MGTIYMNYTTSSSLAFPIAAIPGFLGLSPPLGLSRGGFSLGTTTGGLPPFGGGGFCLSPSLCAIAATDRPATSTIMNNAFLTCFISYLFSSLPKFLHRGKRETSGRLCLRQARCQRLMYDANALFIVGKHNMPVRDDLQIFTISVGSIRNRKNPLLIITDPRRHKPETSNNAIISKW